LKINLNNLNYFINNKNAQSAGNVQDNNTAGSEKINPNSPNVQNALPENAVLSSNVKFNSLSRAQQALLIKELLNIPKDLKEFLAFMLYKDVSADSLNALLNEQNSILLQDIKSLIEANSKDAINKLIKLMHSNAENVQNTEQLKEIISL